MIIATAWMTILVYTAVSDEWATDSMACWLRFFYSWILNLMLLLLRASQPFTSSITAVVLYLVQH